MRGNETWVTYASDDREAVKALILGRSLRRSLTTRILTIFISNEVSDEMLEHLQDGFDRCVKITRQQLDRFPGVAFNIVAKMQCWILNNTDKFAFLDCNVMMLKNSDDLFEQVGFINITNVETDSVVISLIVERPSKDKYKVLVSSYNESNSLVKLIADNHLNEKYNVPCNLGKTNFCRSIPEINMIYFNGNHPIDILPKMNGNEMGIMESAILDSWLELLASIRTNEHCFGTVSKILQMNSVAMQRLRSFEIAPSPTTSFEHWEPLKNSIAIVGMSLRFPGSNNLDEFWDLIINGRDGIIKVPDWRWTDEHCLNRNEDTQDTHAGFLKCPIDHKYLYNITSINSFQKCISKINSPLINSPPRNKSLTFGITI